MLSRASLDQRALPLVAVVLLAALAGGPASATADETPTKTLRLAELWRAGGEEDEIFFGSVGRVTADEQGRVYVLDSQLSQVQVYTSEGEHLATLGREGDGPGEVRRPSDMFLAADGTICLLQGFPGKIVRIDRAGRPAGSTPFDAGGQQGEFGVLVQGRAHDDGMALVGIRMTFGGSSQSQQRYFLALCDRDGKLQETLLEKEHVIDYADLRLDENAMDFVWNRFDVAASGRIYVAPERDAYEVLVYGPEGERVQTIEREQPPTVRSDEQTQRARRIIEAVGANYPTQLAGLTVARTEPVVQGVFARPDDHFWVLTAEAIAKRPAGVFAVLDEFDREGALVRRVALAGPGDPERDALFCLPNGRVAIVTGALDAWLNQQGVSAGEDAAGGEEGAPLELVCYRCE
jgi:hypothetical protein